MAVIQIIYLTLNVVSTAFCLFTLFADFDFDFPLVLFDFIKKKLGTVVTLICSFLLILLFIPTISVMSVLLAFIVAFGYLTE
jgi:hypothetical protein